jgi:SSS family solute:Na+ symporter/sodium/pantothenate symporter
MVAALLCGAGTMLGAYYLGGVLGWGSPLVGEATSFRPYFLIGLDPLLWSLAASGLAGVGVSLLTRTCDEALLSKYFDAQPADSVVPAAAVAEMPA